MFINNKIIGTLIAILFFTVLSCTPKIGEAPPPVSVPALGATQCLSRAAENLQKFVAAEANDSQLNQTWDCVKIALEKFQKYVRGTDKNLYKPNELAQFFSNYFLDRDALGQVKPIPEGLQVEFMKFKQIFIGGSRESITQEELKSLIDFIEDIREITLTLNPFMPVITQKWTPDSNRTLGEQLNYFESANLAIQNVSKKTASLIQANHQAYLFTDFVQFLKELSKFYDAHWDFIGNVEKYLPVVEKIKVAVAGGKESEIGATEWPSFILLGTRGYFQYLRFHYFIEGVSDQKSQLILNYMARTVEDVFSIFQDLVNVKPSQSVTKAETREILLSLSRAYPDFKISDALIDQFMKIKQVFVGGSVDSWTVSDFNSARLKVSKLKDLIGKVIPYQNVYVFDWDPRLLGNAEAQTYFSDSEKVLTGTLAELGDLFESSYSIEDLVGFVEEFEKLYPSLYNSDGPQGTIEYQKISEVIRKYEPIFMTIKTIIYGSPSPVILKEDWKSFLRYTSQAYSKVLYSHYFLKPLDLNSSVGLKSASKFIESTLDIVSDVLTQRNQIGISYQEIGLILNDLKNLNIISGDIKISSLVDLSKVIIENFLVTPEDRLAGRIQKSFTGVSLERLKSEIRHWIQPETVLAEIFENPQTQNPDQATLLDLIDKKKNESGVSLEMQESLAELSLVFKTPFPVTTDLQGRMLITNMDVPKYNRTSVYYANLSRTISRLLIRAYTTDLTRLKNYEGLNKCEADKAFDDVRRPIADLNIIDLNDSFISARYTETNIFTIRANGDRLVSFVELNDLIQMLLSGFKNDSRLKDQLRKDCPVSSGTQAKTETVLFGCLRKSYYKSIKTEMLGVPGYIKYMNSTYEPEWRGAFVNMLKAAGWVPKGLANRDQEIVPLNTISLFPHIVQYMEMLIAKYDRNKDSILSTYDVVRAFPVFKTLLADLAKDSIRKGFIDESDLQAVFTYIVRYGKEPGLSSLFTWLHWKSSPEDWDVWADRTQIAKVLGYIADKIADKDKTKLISTAPQCSN